VALYGDHRKVLNTTSPEHFDTAALPAMLTAEYQD